LDNSILRRVALVVGILLVAAGSTLAGFSIARHVSPMTVIVQNLPRFVPTPMQVFGKSNILVLVEGLDYDYTDNDVEYSTQSRSDIIKVVNVDFANKRVYVLSVPRDMLATYPNGTKQKINAAQGMGGEKLASQVISSFLGIPGFDRYAIFRIDATKDMINAIGGVDVYVKTSDCLENHTGCTGGRIDYDDNWGHLHVHLTEGKHHLNGDQAVSYSRFRHDWCSDPCRIMRQDDVINALVNKLKGDKLNTLMNAGNLMKVVRKDVQTNVTQPEMVSLAAYFSGITTKNIHFDQVPYTGDEELADGDDLIPDQAGKAKLVNSMLVAPPTPEPSPDAMALAAIVPGTLRVDVENGSGQTGAAKHVATLLRRAGFTIGEIGDAPTSDYVTTQIREHSPVTWAGAKVRSALPGSLQHAHIERTQADSSSPDSSDVTVIVGRDLATLVADPPVTPRT
jgi:polyisoprenyl-teichoic acid--peptidoglycan teichoic acid transferase